jgi:membrane-associated phospholipid phosphatase
MHSRPAASSPRLPLHWPDAVCRRTTLFLGTSLTLLWLAIYGGADWITSLHGYRLPLRSSIDASIPFVPAAAVVYLSLFAMLWLSPFVLQTSVELRAFARSLCIVIVIAGMGFVLLPVEPIDAVSVDANFLGRVFQFADHLNLTYNAFPSLHVALALVCAVGFSRHAPPAAKFFYGTWAGAIAVATLLTHQHSVIDVLAGGLLGAGVACRLQ